jgi:capsular exopolysaccharide synthesis family protein
LPSRRRRRDRSYSASGGYEASSFEEAIRILRSSLEVALTDLAQPRVIFTSALPEEGKTTVCTQTALSFASAGRRTVLVDLDLRRPAAHRLVGAHNEFGATDVLLRRRPLDEVMQYVEVPSTAGGGRSRLYVLAAGPAVTNPAEVLGSGRTLRLLDALAEQADLVLVDAPPVLPVADTLVIGRIASGAILVTEARATALPAVQKAKDLLVRNQTRLLGVVLNKFDVNRDGDPYGYGWQPDAAEPADAVGGAGTAVAVEGGGGPGPQLEDLTT